MRKRNVRTKKYIGKKDKFADLCNYVLFDGKQVIKPESLKEKDVTELGIPFSEKGGQAVEKIRDLLKSCTMKTAQGVAYLVIGIENQTEIHYAMVVRNMVQDALNYAAQVEAFAQKHRRNKDLRGAEFLSGFAKEDKLIPVVTITLYWNGGAWDGPRSLHEMFANQNKEVLKFVPDYRLNLVVPDEIKDFGKFVTELGPVLEFCQCSRDKEKIRKLLKEKEKSGFFLERESVEVLNECVNAGIKLPEEKGAKVDMCKGIEDWIAEEKAEGRAEGRAEGADRMGKLVSILLEQNMIEEAKHVASDKKIREEYYTLYNI
ncbi:MAG: transposase [Lachnospiraceae bacterium]|nr:transposase [Lachnospiraceae bacterium]